LILTSERTIGNFEERKDFNLRRKVEHCQTDDQLGEEANEYSNPIEFISVAAIGKKTLNASFQRRLRFFYIE
jgi:hypothetical protein